MARWQGEWSERSATTLQVYFDHTDRDEVALREKHDTLDIDFQHRYVATKRAEIVWGLGYRHIDDNFENSFTLTLAPDSKTQDVWSAFIQGEVSLIEDELQLLLGSKFEDNDYTGFEYQPSIRLI